MVTDGDRDLVGKNLSNHRSGKLRAMQFFETLHEREPSQWIVVFPTGERTDASHCAVHSAKAAAVALAPDDTLVVGRSDLAPLEDEGPVCIEDELCVVKTASVALIHAYDQHHPMPSGCFTELPGDGSGHFNSAMVKSQVFFAN